MLFIVMMFLLLEKIRHNKSDIRVANKEFKSSNSSLCHCTIQQKKFSKLVKSNITEILVK